jgi:hypothetical protein
MNGQRGRAVPKAKVWPQARKKLGAPVYYEAGLYSRVSGVSGVSDFSGVGGFCRFMCVSGVSDVRLIQKLQKTAKYVLFGHKYVVFVYNTGQRPEKKNEVQYTMSLALAPALVALVVFA